MRRFLTYLACMVMCSALLSGCGGGGGSSSPSGGGGGGTGGPGNGGGGGTPLTSAKIMVTITATQTKFQQLLDTVPDTATRDQQLVDFLKTQPTVASANLGKPGCVSARLTNNQYYVIIDNRDPAPANTTGIGDIAAHAAAQISARTASASHTASVVPHDATTGFEIPQSKQARLLRALNTDVFGDAVPAISDMLQRRGYNVITQQATVEILHSISGDGIFYLDAHGGMDYDPVTQNFWWSIWTDTSVTEQGNSLYQADLNDGSLVYMTAKNGRIPTDTKKFTLDTHYAFTSRFIHKYNWSFAPHSLAYLNICYGAVSNTGANTDLASLPHPAGSTIGWDAPVAGRAIPDAYYIFDRLLGLNYITPIAPTKQRPFASGAIYTRLSDYNVNVDNTKSGIAVLIFGGAHDFILTPQIQTMDMRERIAEGPLRGKTQLTLNGAFGTQQGTVKVGGTEVPITSWARDKVVCQPADVPGSGFSGDVEVSIDDHDSNAVSLTQWHGKVTYLTDIYPRQVRMIQSKITVDAYFRADTHAYRTDPDKDPIKPAAVAFRASQGSKAHWEVIGGPPPAATWVGPTSSDLPFGLNGTANAPYGTGYILSGTLDRKNNQAHFSFNYLGCDVPYVIAAAPAITLLPNHDTALTSTQSGVNTADGYGIFQTNLPASFDEDDVIPAETLNGNTAVFNPTLQFDDFVPSSVPDKSNGEDQDPH